MAIRLCVPQFSSKIAACSFELEITRMISDQIPFIALISLTIINLTGSQTAQFLIVYRSIISKEYTNNLCSISFHLFEAAVRLMKSSLSNANKSLST